MKQTLILALSCLLLFSCGKESNQPTPTVPKNDSTNQTSSFKFLINGVTDMTFGKDSFATIAIGVAREAGTQERVTLSVEGLPPNATAEFSSASGTPDFATTLTLKGNGAVPGTYALKLKGVAEKGAIKSYDFNAVITGPKPGEPDPVLGCAKDLLGDYRSDYVHNHKPTQVFEHAAVESTGVKNEIEITAAVFTRPILATIDCNTMQLTIPDQPAMDYTLVNGSGYVSTDGKIHLSYMMTGVSGSQSVTEVLTKK